MSTEAAPKVEGGMRTDSFAVCRPERYGAFEFVVVSTLRAAQLMRGCIPRVEVGRHKATIVAQREVASGQVSKVIADPIPVPAIL